MEDEDPFTLHGYLTHENSAISTHNADWVTVFQEEEISITGNITATKENTTG